MLQPHGFWATLRSEQNASRLIILVLLCYPALLLTVKGSMGILFGLTLIVSLFLLYRMHKLSSVTHWDGYAIAFSFAMASPVVAIFLSQAYHGVFKAAPYDWASRFLLAIPIFLALRQVNIRIITVLQFGVPLGAVISMIVLKVHPYNWSGTGRYTTSIFFNLIHFSDTALILGFLSLFSINWERRDHPLILLLKLCGFAAGVYMSIQSGERGGWLAIPLLLLLWGVAHSKRNLWLKLGIATLLVVVAAWLGYALVEVVRYRVDMVFSDIHAYTLGNKDTSIGVRFQLYLAAIHLFAEHPLFGVGPGQFAQFMPELNASGMLTPLAAQMGNSEVHNEILHKCAETGLFGLVSILAVYFVPLYIFWHSSKSTLSVIRTASFMGICLVMGFFIFGLTVELFDLKMTATFFAFTLAILMAAATHHDDSQMATK